MKAVVFWKIVWALGGMALIVTLLCSITAAKHFSTLIVPPGVSFLGQTDLTAHKDVFEGLPGLDTGDMLDPLQARDVGLLVREEHCIWL